MASISPVEGLSFDDVTLEPRFSTITSRHDLGQVDTTTELIPGVSLRIPIISANMDTITERDMALAMFHLGGCGFLHRFMTVDRAVSELKSLRETKGLPTVLSTGVNGPNSLVAILDNYSELVDIVCIDVAHAQTTSVLDEAKRIRECYGKPIIVGNVSTPSAALALAAAAHVSAIKIGQGPGSLCQTRVVTGNGVPQLTAIMTIHDSLEQRGLRDRVRLIADGGIRSSGDIVKALAAGADSVMIGGLLAGCNETPGPTRSPAGPEFVPDQYYKTFRGSASSEAQLAWKGQVSVDEGVSTKVPLKGPVSKVIDALVRGLRSGMSYQGAANLRELRRNAIFIRQSYASLLEGHPHHPTLDK